MNLSDTTRYKAGDEIVKMIFCQCNKLDEKSHIANRVIILDKLFSTNIQRFKGDGGIDAIIKILQNSLHSNSKTFQDLKDDSDVSELIDKMLREYGEKTENLGIKGGCQSFLTKYLFWHSYSIKNKYDDNIEEKYDDKFFIYDSIVAEQIGFKLGKWKEDFYKEWYTAMNTAKDKLDPKLNNREVDLYYWNLGKNTRAILKYLEKANMMEHKEKMLNDMTLKIKDEIIKK